MARMVLVIVDGIPARVWHDEAQAQGDAERLLVPADAGQPQVGSVELWDVPVGRTPGEPVRVEAGGA